MIEIIKLLFYILLSIFLIISCFIKNIIVNDSSKSICIYLLVKWITDYRKCTISYLECKIRGVKKEEGIIYNILEGIFDINKEEYRFIIYLIVFIILFINIKKTL